MDVQLTSNSHPFSQENNEGKMGGFTQSKGTGVRADAEVMVTFSLEAEIRHP